MMCKFVTVHFLLLFLSIYRPKNTFTLLRVLAEAIGSSYVEAAIEA